MSNGLVAQEGASIYERSIQSLVTIEGATAQGSGFVVAPELVATNYHVISGMSRAFCYQDREGPRYEVAGFLLADKENDLILLKVPGLKEKPLMISPYPARPGQRIYVMGTPIGLEGTISEGLVSALRTFEGVQKIQMSAPTSKGSSGGPVMNLSGEVIGVSCSGRNDGENINFAVPAEKLKKLLTGISDQVHNLGGLPPMETNEEDASVSHDMGKAELIYSMGLSEEASLLSLDYLVHFRDSTCLYFTYDMTDVSPDDTLMEYWISDYRIIDLGSGDVFKAVRSNLPASDANPIRLYRGTKVFYAITFPRLPPSVRNFHLLEGNCEEFNYCFRNIRLRSYRTADGLDWRTYENPEPEGTVSFYSRSLSEKFTVNLGNVNLGTLSEPWRHRSETPNCGHTGKSVITARLMTGTYAYKAISHKRTITGEVNVSPEGCLMIELGQ